MNDQNALKPTILEIVSDGIVSRPTDPTKSTRVEYDADVHKPGARRPVQVRHTEWFRPGQDIKYLQKGKYIVTPRIRLEEKFGAMQMNCTGFSLVAAPTAASGPQPVSKAS